jgi:DNA-binding HxlR family transcriptional regulator
MTCSVAQCLDVVGEWWSLLIVRDAFLGVTRFDDFQARLGISRNILTQRLNHLVENDVLKRVAYSEHPPRSEYRLTAKGRDLWHVVMAMRQWGDRWAAPDGPPVQTKHAGCGHVITAVPVCSHCGETLDARAVTAIPGPGASQDGFDRTSVAGSQRSPHLAGKPVGEPGTGLAAAPSVLSSTAVVSGPMASADRRVPAPSPVRAARAPASEAAPQGPAGIP